jgi:hypothetical protein
MTLQSNAVMDDARLQIYPLNKDYIGAPNLLNFSDVSADTKRLATAARRRAERAMTGYRKKR